MEGWTVLLTVLGAGVLAALSVLINLDRRRPHRPWASNQHPGLGGRLVRSEVIEVVRSDVPFSEPRTTVSGLLPAWAFFHHGDQHAGESDLIARTLFGARALKELRQGLQLSAEGGELTAFTAPARVLSEGERRYVEEAAITLAVYYLITPEPELVRRLVEAVTAGEARALRILALHFPSAADQTQCLLPACLGAASPELRLAAAELAQDRSVLRALALDAEVATRTRIAALQILAQGGELDTLLAVADGACAGVELPLIRALVRADDARVGPALLRFVAHDNPEIVEACADFLARRGTATALAEMRKRLERGRLSDRAQTALRVAIELVTERSQHAPGALSLSPQAEAGGLAVAADAGALGDPEDSGS